jgi:hypothetical protein
MTQILENTPGSMFEFAESATTKDSSMDSDWSITVNNMTGGTLTLRVKPQDSIQSVKELITKHWGQSAISQQLYNADGATDSSALAGMVKDGLENGACVVMVVVGQNITSFDEEKHGRTCQFSNCGRTLKRTQGFYRAVAFSSQALCEQGEFSLHIDSHNTSGRGWSGALEIGVVSFDPSTLLSAQVAGFDNLTDVEGVGPHARNKDSKCRNSLSYGSSGQACNNAVKTGCWDPNSLQTGDVVRVLVSASTEDTRLEIFVNNEPNGDIVGPPLHDPSNVHAAIGVYGKTEQVTFC